jgi:hypothetical protein
VLGTASFAATKVVEIQMSENSRGSGGGLYFVVGGLVVVVGLGAFLYTGGNFGSLGSKTTTQQTTSSAPAPAGNVTTTTTTEKTKH